MGSLYKVRMFNIKLASKDQNAQTLHLLRSQLIIVSLHTIYVKLLGYRYRNYTKEILLIVAEIEAFMLQEKPLCKLFPKKSMLRNMQEMSEIIPMHPHTVNHKINLRQWNTRQAGLGYGLGGTLFVGEIKYIFGEIPGTTKCYHVKSVNASG